MIDKTTPIKIRNIDTKVFTFKAEDLKNLGITIPQNLENYSTFNLEEFVITDKDKIKYFRIQDSKQKNHIIIRGGMAFHAANWQKWAKNMCKLLTEEERKTGLTISQLQQKNIDLLNKQLKLLSKKVYYQNDSPFAKFFKGETQQISPSTFIKRQNIKVKAVQTTLLALRQSGIQVPFGLSEKIILNEIVVTSPSEKRFMLVRENSADLIRKQKLQGSITRMKETSRTKWALYYMFGEEECNKGKTFKQLQEANKQYIEKQLNRLAKLEQQNGK